ncbi:tetratricopeptide repeat protein [Desulfohalobiaceae bacterium Ax17]|uniref:tetratricopeptide repeat protein n=1 Tax=Desulfovulcanus ferrireducens TaxID=2831190 RepID=UPI00207BB2B3|nr:tetratricopeptide repeat protein [Desulfovulcanus ferrireducens]MBT8763979.1 tetratricopeptide repeat protein [Desulfovulcanus ferrireducens]
MCQRLQLLVISLTLLLCACLPNGKRFLVEERYEEGIRAFEQVLQEDPENHEANYYIGRFYLAQEKPDKALPYLRRAVQLAPDKADYHFWLGVAYWAVRDFENERKSYRQALKLNKDHVPARLYLAHNLLDSGQWEAALKEYDGVLKNDPYNPEALYNRGLALKKLNKPVEEINAWKKYLKYYPRGRWALQAVDHLNALGDFSYRNFTIGYRRVTLKNISFTPGTDNILLEAKPSLKVLGGILSINKKIVLKIIGYKKGDPVLAKARAKAVKDFLLKNFPDIDPARLTYDGFGRAERVRFENKTYFLNESISFVTLRK